MIYAENVFFHYKVYRYLQGISLVVWELKGFQHSYTWNKKFRCGRKKRPSRLHTKCALVSKVRLGSRYEILSESILSDDVISVWLFPFNKYGHGKPKDAAMMRRDFVFVGWGSKVLIIKFKGLMMEEIVWNCYKWLKIFSCMEDWYDRDCFFCLLRFEYLWVTIICNSIKLRKCFWQGSCSWRFFRTLKFLEQKIRALLNGGGNKVCRCWPTTLLKGCCIVDRPRSIA